MRLRIAGAIVFLVAMVLLSLAQPQVSRPQSIIAGRAQPIDNFFFERRLAEGTALNGSVLVKRASDGTLIYFYRGQWTATPPPAGDLPNMSVRPIRLTPAPVLLDRLSPRGQPALLPSPQLRQLR